jgi:Arm DNA-binding domain/Phage integrase, N-terminal SAM-like domain
MVAKLTKTMLLAAKAEGKGRRLLWDSELTGLGARVSQHSITFVLRYQHGPFERKMTLGRLAELGSVEAARRKAAEIRLAVRAGFDPLHEVRERRKITEGELTLEVALERWLKSNPTKWAPATAAAYRKIIAKNVIPTLGACELARITRAQWADMLTGVAVRAPGVANFLHKILASFMGWAIDRELLEASTLPSAKRVAPRVAARERVVTDDEIRSLWAASAALESRQRAFCRLVVLSALRSGAALRSRPEWIVGRSIVYPGNVHGLKRQADRRSMAHKVSFTDWAWEQIRSLEDPFLPFPQGIATATLKALRQATQIGDVEWHDIRRSFRSFCARTGIGRDAAETVLGHVIHKNEVDRAYNRHSYEREAEQAFHAWQRHVQTLIEGESASNVVTLAR